MWIVCLSAFPSQQHKIHIFAHVLYISTCSTCVATAHAQYTKQPNRMNAGRNRTKCSALSFFPPNQLLVALQPFSTDGFDCYSSTVQRSLLSISIIFVLRTFLIAVCEFPVFILNNYLAFFLILKSRKKCCM